MSNSKLPADKVQEIEKEANDLYCQPYQPIESFWAKDGYVTGATVEAEKAAEQLSAKDKEIESLRMTIGGVKMAKGELKAAYKKVEKLEKWGKSHLANYTRVCAILAKQNFELAEKSKEIEALKAEILKLKNK